MTTFKSTADQIVQDMSDSSSNGRFALYDKYVPDIESYSFIQKPRTSLTFPLNFPKPVRPGNKRRSKPSTLKRRETEKRYFAAMSEPSLPGVFYKMSPSESFQESDETSASEEEDADESVSGKKLPFWDKIKGICPCLKKKKKAPTSDTDESPKSVPSEAEGSGEPEEPVSPEGLSHYISESRYITTVPPSLSPDFPKREQKLNIKSKNNARLTQPPDTTELKSVYSIFRASQQPPETHVQEPPKPPKGILKSSEEKVQVGKSVSIILPSERDEGKPSPALMRKQSTTHFQSQEMSSATKDNAFPPSGVSPATDIHKEGSSSPITSLRSRVLRPPVPSAGAPLQNATAEDPPKGQEDVVLKPVTAPEASPPKPPSPHTTDQETLSTAKASPLQVPSEKMVPTTSYQFQEEVDPVLVTSLRNQRRAHLYARASAPSQKTVKKNSEKEKEEAEKDSGKAKKEAKDEPLASPLPQSPAGAPSQETKEKSSEKEKEEAEKDSGKAKKEAKDEPLARPPPQSPAGAPSQKNEDKSSEKEKEEYEKDSGKAKKEAKTEPLARATSQSPAAKDTSLSQDEKMPPEPPTGQVYMEDVPLPTLSPEPKTHSPALTRNSRLRDITMEGSDTETGTFRGAAMASSPKRLLGGRKSAPLVRGLSFASCGQVLLSDYNKVDQL